jgi:hypothetical protein
MFENFIKHNSICSNCHLKKQLLPSHRIIYIPSHDIISTFGASPRKSADVEFYFLQQFCIESVSQRGSVRKYDFLYIIDTY